MSGKFQVNSLLFTVGDLTLTVGPYEILMQVAADGSLVDPYLWPRSAPGTVAARRWLSAGLSFRPYRLAKAIPLS